jgi:isopentenyldiphosphate isomerase
MAAGEEYVDVIDEDDRVIGRASRREVRSGNLLHREVAALVRDDEGRIFVHRRTESKDVFPGRHDMFVAGVVGAGERYEEAIRRELAEEVGVEGVEPAFLFAFRYRDAVVNAWTRCYEVGWDGPVRLQEEEVAWGAFLPEAELLDRLDAWPFVPDGVHAFRRYLEERGRWERPRPGGGG